MRSLPLVLLSAFATIAPAAVPAVALRAQAGAEAAPQRVTYFDLLRAMVDLDWLWLPPAPGERCIQFSSYDRKSDAGPDGGDAWWANADTGQFLRVERGAGGREEHVMVDCAGPGSVVRIWSADPKGRLRFYVDGATAPTWEVDFAALTSGTLAPFLEPLAGVRARGHNCHLPFPFGKHLKVTCDAPKFYYQVNVRLWGEGTEVESFTPQLLERHRDAIDAVRAELVRVKEPQLRLLEDDVVRLFHWASADAKWSGPGSETLIDLEGPVVLRDWVLHWSPNTDGAVTARDSYRYATLRLTVDGHETVTVPLSDFFGAAPDLQPHHGLVMGVSPNGHCWSRWPIPARQRLKLVLEWTRRATSGSWSFDSRHEKRDVPADALTFHASWHLQKDVKTRPFSDHLVLNASGGSGRFVGCALSVRNPVKAWWGEGDEKFWVDGEAFPSTFGTGTEDYFGYAWCSNETFSSPYHAQPQCDGPANFGYAAVNRWQIPDTVPFQNTFRFDLEVWHWNQKCTVDYATTAYWYAKADAQSGLPPLPPPAERLAPVQEPPFKLLVQDAIEGESLKVRTITGGKRQKQDCGGFEGGSWSADEQLWWTGAQPGDRLTLDLPVPAAGRWRVLAVFTKAADYAIVQPHLAEAKLGAPIDLYHPSVVPSERLELGTVELPAGTVPFTLEIVGKNERAIPQYMAGIDYLLLQKAE